MGSSPCDNCDFEEGKGKCTANKKAKAQDTGKCAFLLTGGRWVGNYGYGGRTVRHRGK